MSDDKQISDEEFWEQRKYAARLEAIEAGCLIREMANDPHYDAESTLGQAIVEKLNEYARAF